MRNDLAAALHSFRSARSFTATALIVLTLGIGATTAIFSVVDAVVLRGLPFDEHDRLVAVGQRMPSAGRPVDPNRDPAQLSSVAPQNYLDWAAQQQVFESIAAVGSGWLTLREPGVEPESLVPQRVTAGFFNVLRVAPAIGRAFGTEHEVEGRDRVAVLSDGLWRRRFGADPGIVGRTIPLEVLEGGQAATEGGYEVVGVMPPAFMYPVGAARGTDVWIPLVIPASDRRRDPTRMFAYLQVIARLKPDVAVTQAQAQMDQVAVAIEQANPVWNKDSRIGVRPLIDHVVGARIRSWMLMLLGAVVVVLLIACANLASLLLARGSVRQRDIAVRSALGASRARLVRQLVLESLLLAGAGTVCGIVLAWWTVDLLRASMPEGVPRVATIGVNFRVLLAAAATVLATALLFGLGPALQVSRVDLAKSLRDGGRSGAITRQPLRSMLVVAEVALAVVLLVGAALFIGSFVSLIRIDPGFSPEQVLTAQISPRLESTTKPVNRSAALHDIVHRVSRIPGVAHASILSGVLPFTDGLRTTSFPLPGSNLQIATLSMKSVTPEYHQALRIRLLRGRFFDVTDREGAPSVAILNETAATQFFPGQDAIGRDFQAAAIVGVVADVRQNGLEGETLPEMYRPLAQGEALGGELVVRTRDDAMAVLPAIRAAVYAVLPDVPLRNVRTLEQMLARRLAQRRLNMLLLGLFGLLGLVIAAVGVYGLMAFVVAQRTREIGVRMALGASRSAVVSMVMRKSLGLVLSGLVIGSVASWYLSGAARAFLFRLEPTDGRAFAAAALSILIAALAATAVPARRAAGVDPVIALRTD